MEAFDYVVVGAGTAGCLLANRLSADPAVRVLLLEAGKRDNYIWVHIPVGYLYCMGNPRTDWLFETVAERGLNGRALKYPRGKVWGGCSSINGMIYMRGQSGDYDGWAKQNPGWSWDEVLPYFRRHEDHYSLDGGGENPAHGHGGEWRVEQQRLSWPILSAFREAAEQSGIPPTDDFTRGDNFGCGYFEVNQRRGVRWSAAKGFLHPVLGRSNLVVISGARVNRLVLGGEGGRQVTGVEYRVDDGAVTVAEARREVVMAAGSIGTTQILQRSGIGAGAHLQGAGIKPQVELAGVGGNLQDHLQLRTIFRVRPGVTTLNGLANSIWGKAWMGMQYALFKRGPMTMAPSQLGAFAKSDPGQASANLEWHIQPLSLDRFGEPLHRFPAFTASVCNLRPTSRGTVLVSSPDPEEAPLIAPNYLSTSEDRDVAVKAVRMTRQIVAAPALREFKPQEYLPGAEVDSDEDLARAAGDIGATIFHPVGTCKMGPEDDPLAVVDARLRVHGIRGLRVADASVMPTITSGNTCSPVLMIAERAAEMIRSDHG